MALPQKRIHKIELSSIEPESIEKLRALGEQVGLVFIVNIASPLPADKLVSEFAEVVRGLINPVIAVVTTSVAESQMAVVEACHLAFASSTAAFAIQNETGDCVTVSAEAACDGGAINSVHEDPLANAQAVAGQIIERAPLAVRAAIKAVGNGDQSDSMTGFERELDLFCEMFETSDMRSGTAAFIKKKNPVFEGK